jgi:hypothetical protein
MQTRLLIAAVMWCAGCSTMNERGDSKPNLVLSVPYNTHGARTAYIDADPPYPFHVVLTNEGLEPVKLWQEFVSWGYFALEFQIVLPNSTTASVRRKPITFYANGPARLTLNPNESVVWDVYFSSTEWDGLSFTEDDEELKCSLKAVYAAGEDEYSKAYGIWTGQVQSDSYNVVVQKVSRHSAR